MPGHRPALLLPLLGYAGLVVWLTWPLRGAELAAWEQVVEARRPDLTPVARDGGDLLFRVTAPDVLPDAPSKD